MPNSFGCATGLLVRFNLLQPRQQCLTIVRKKPSTSRNFSAHNGSSKYPYQALTWIAEDPHNVTPDDITPAYAHFHAASEQSSIVPILFASPKFAAWTDPTGSLLAQWVTPLFDKVYFGNAPNVVHTIAAVVDGISTPKKFNNGKNTYAEGLSLLLANGSYVNASTLPSTLFRGSSSSQEPSFFMRTQTADRSADKSQATPHLSCEIGLRLARTVFLNGRDRTLLAMRWIRNGTSGVFNLDQCQELSTCSVASVTNEAHRSISVPLYPVTSRRRVVSSMGNILRQVSKSPAGEADIDAGVPASLELERELPRYVNELGIPHQRVAVWALVEPSKTAGFAAENHTRHDFQKSILSGGKIHRVVSGGGGWGKKQGLLSLDPETAFGDRLQSSSSVPLNELFRTTRSSDNNADDLSDMAALQDILQGKELEEEIASLSQVATLGDYIQFYVGSSGSEANIDGSLLSPAPFTCSFGVEAPVEETEVIDSSAKATSTKITVIRDHFGAISESAISYSQEDFSEPSNCGTKISVPGSRVDFSMP